MVPSSTAFSKEAQAARRSADVNSPLRSFLSSAEYTSVNDKTDEETFSPSVSFPKNSLSDSRANSFTRTAVSRYIISLISAVSIFAHKLFSAFGSFANRDRAQKLPIHVKRFSLLLNRNQLGFRYTVAGYDGFQAPRRAFEQTGKTVLGGPNVD